MNPIIFLSEQLCFTEKSHQRLEGDKISGILCTILNHSDYIINNEHLSDCYTYMSLADSFHNLPSNF